MTEEKPIEMEDDGSPKWAEYEAIKMLAIAMYRHDQKYGPLDAALSMERIKNFTEQMIYENPRLKEAYLEYKRNKEQPIVR